MSLDACSLLPRSLVESTLPGAVTRVRALSADDFMSPPPGDSVACAYETNGRYGQLIVATWSMSRSAYQARYVTRDPVNTRKVHNVGDDARFFACGALDIYMDGRVLALGIRFADCNAVRRLVSLGRVALRQL